MKSAELIIVWGSLGLALYAFVVYPLLIALASRFARDSSDGPELDAARTFAWPRVSLLIAARREEGIIVERLRNAAALNYPPDRVEILVGCDGEGDLTPLLARSFEDPRVKVVQLPEARGMAAVLDECAARATGEILVFSDVNTMMRPDAVRRLVRHFQRGDVGAVCGKLLPIDPMTGRNVSGLYSRFEDSLDRGEARLGVPSRINTGIYSVRKSLYRPATESTSDSAKPLRGASQHDRLVYDETAVAVEERLPTLEVKSRGRIGSREDASWSQRLLRPLLSPRSKALGFVCRLHKRLRQCGLGFLIAAFVSNACLSSDPFYLHLMLLHESFYLCALVGLFLAGGNRWRRIVRAPFRLFTRLAARPRGPQKTAESPRSRTTANHALH